MNVLPYTLDEDDPTAPPMGLIVLQVDETIEPELHGYFDGSPGPLYVSRIPSGSSVTRESLGAMEANLVSAADLLPKARPYPVVGYGCTSASSIIGSDRVETLVQQSCNAASVTNPLRAAIARAAELGVSRLALLSPYIEEVSEPLRIAFARSGISTDAFGSFCEPEESKVVRISVDSIVDAAANLGADTSVEAVFISCTNLRTYAAIRQIEARIDKPVMSSNQVLAWHMLGLKTTISH